MTERVRGKLHVVTKPVEPPLDMADDIYAEGRAAALDYERWRRMHVRCERSEEVYLPDKPVRRVIEPRRTVKEFRP